MHMTVNAGRHAVLGAVPSVLEKFGLHRRPRLSVGCYKHPVL